MNDGYLGWVSIEAEIISRNDQSKKLIMTEKLNTFIILIIKVQLKPKVKSLFYFSQ